MIIIRFLLDSTAAMSGVCGVFEAIEGAQQMLVYGTE